MKKARKKKPIALIARARAAWNKDNGGVLLTGEFLRCKDGNRYRVLVDGGNRYHGKATWVISSASGAGYSLEDEAMATAVASVIGVECGCSDDKVQYSNWGANWKEIAKKAGWTLLDWGAAAGNIALIPSDDLAKKIQQEFNAWEEKYGI